MMKRFKGQRGQGMTEYIIIVALIAIAAIAVIVLFGDNIRTQFGKAARAVGGHDTDTVGETKQGADDMWKHRTLKDFGKSADAGMDIAE
jgi:Flp pilus assembly pilin Flp